MNKKVDAHLRRVQEARERRGPLRGTTLLGMEGLPNLVRLLGHVGEALLLEAEENKPDAERLGEPLQRARLRAAGGELRHLVEFVGETSGEDGDAADRRLAKWAEAQKREILRLAVRFERRLGPKPEVKEGARRTGGRKRGKR